MVRSRADVVLVISFSKLFNSISTSSKLPPALSPEFSAVLLLVVVLLAFGAGLVNPDDAWTGELAGATDSSFMLAKFFYVKESRSFWYNVSFAAATFGAVGPEKITKIYSLVRWGSNRNRNPTFGLIRRIYLHTNAHGEAYNYENITKCEFEIASVSRHFSMYAQKRVLLLILENVGVKDEINLRNVQSE